MNYLYDGKYTVIATNVVTTNNTNIPNGATYVAPPPNNNSGPSNQGGYTITVPNPNALTSMGWVTITLPGLQCDPIGTLIVEDGCTCRKCKDFCEFAEPNQEDGSFICYKCRKGW